MNPLFGQKITASFPKTIDPQADKGPSAFHAKRLIELYGTKFSPVNYIHYREQYDQSLPALTTVYRLYDSWPGFVRAMNQKAF